MTRTQKRRWPTDLAATFFLPMRASIRGSVLAQRSARHESDENLDEVEIHQPLVVFRMPPEFVSKNADFFANCATPLFGSCQRSGGLVQNSAL